MANQQGPSSSVRFVVEILLVLAIFGLIALAGHLEWQWWWSTAP